MVLTDAQRTAVEENEKLIYWYINMRGLNLDEWYGLLAIELCKTVAKFDNSKGSLANYFKLRCDGLVSKEFRKLKAKKRFHFPIEYSEGEFGESLDVKLVELMAWIGETESNVLKLKLQGYSQKEIAKMLGMSQSQVSRTISEFRGKFELDR